ncbi:hypothetical protein JVX93_21665 [Mycolicibacterium boenickei]|nr:hypothetical protein JVX93_21665 [Mycolicibacterium boenickei]
MSNHDPAIEAVMAKALLPYLLGDDSPVSDTVRQQFAHAVADVALAALKAARIAVVELPEPCPIPSRWGEDCLGAWEAINYGADPVSAWPDRRRGVALPDATFISNEAARDLAAALLAAADAAEADHA